jgi:hypothetical protein
VSACGTFRFRGIRWDPAPEGPWRSLWGLFYTEQQQRGGAPPPAPGGLAYTAILGSPSGRYRGSCEVASWHITEVPIVAGKVRSSGLSGLVQYVVETTRMTQSCRSCRNAIASLAHFLGFIGDELAVVGRVNRE